MHSVVDKTSGDITSMVFNGIEVRFTVRLSFLRCPIIVWQTQDQGSKKSHINSGIGASCSWVRTGHDNNYIKITCNASGITQYDLIP